MVKRNPARTELYKEGENRVNGRMGRERMQESVKRFSVTRRGMQLNRTPICLGS